MANGIDLASALQTAVELEITGLETYLRFARRTDDVTGKNMFIRLAHDEVQHWKLLQDQQRLLREEGKLSSVDAGLKPLEVIKPRIRAPGQKTGDVEHADELAALQSALDLERRSAEFYRNQSQKATDPEVRRLFGALTEIEESHIDLIQAEIDNLTLTGYWFDSPEFRLEAG